VTPIEKHCETECREDILERMNGCVLKSGVWKFISVLVVILTFAYGVAITMHASGNERQESRIKESEQQIMTNTVNMAKMQASLDQLKEGQKKLEDKLENLGAQIIKEVKRSR
jgi:Tfp pilus assembly protein PilO